jgi:hypothetical protein
MELTKNIFFNTDKLLQNSKVKISYTGTFLKMVLKKYLFIMVLELIGIIYLKSKWKKQN